VIIAARLRAADAAGRSGALIEGWSTGLSAYAPAQVEKVTGVAASRVERLARQFADMRPAVAIIGGPPLAHTNGLFSALAVNALMRSWQRGAARRSLLHAAADLSAAAKLPNVAVPPPDRWIVSRGHPDRRCAGPASAVG